MEQKIIISSLFGKIILLALLKFIGSSHLSSASSLCDDCPFVIIPDEPCSTKWIPQYVLKSPQDSCDCLKEYYCCPKKCVEVDANICKKGEEMSVSGQDSCNCPTLQCIKCPPVATENEKNCGVCFEYSIEQKTTGCFEALCKRKDHSKYPTAKCNNCETEVVEIDSCGYKKSSCKKIPCPCDPAPSCFGSQVLTVKSGDCNCQKLTCDCNRQCPDISEPVCDDRGNLHQNWCEFGIAACKLETSLQILKIAPLSFCQGKGYEELRDFGAKWRRFWWYDSQASDSVWPTEEKDVLGHPFGACAPNASHCFGRLPEHLRQDSTLLLAIDGKGNAYKWKFDAGNPTSNAAWRAFHDHAETPAGAIKNNKGWNPEVMKGNRPSNAVNQDSFMYREQFGVKSVILDDDNCDCLSTLSMGSGMCLQGQETRYGPAKVFGVDNLDDPGCETPEPSKTLSLYFSEQ